MHADFSAGGLSGTLDEVLNGTTIYLQSPLLTSNLPKGKTWLKLDLQKAAPKGVDLSALTTQSPTKLLSQLQAAGNVTKVGDETINGTATTHYRAKLDLSKLPKVRHSRTRPTPRSTSGSGTTMATSIAFTRRTRSRLRTRPRSRSP